MPPDTTDTSVEAEAIQLELLRRMSPADRITNARKFRRFIVRGSSIGRGWLRFLTRFKSDEFSGWAQTDFNDARGSWLLHLAFGVSRENPDSFTGRAPPAGRQCLSPAKTPELRTPPGNAPSSHWLVPFANTPTTMIATTLAPEAGSSFPDIDLLDRDRMADVGFRCLLRPF